MLALRWWLWRVKRVLGMLWEETLALNAGQHIHGLLTSIVVVHTRLGIVCRLG